MPPKQIRCTARKSEKTCERDPTICEWRDGKCVFRVNTQHQADKKQQSPDAKEDDNERKSLKQLLSPSAIKKVNRIRLRMEVRQAAKPLLYRNAGCMTSRLRMHKIVNRYLENVDTCLTWDKDNKRLFLGNAIDLTKQIGSKSVYGVAYLSKGNGFGKLIKVACKLMAKNKSNQKELEVLNAVSKEVIEERFMNFPLLYVGLECDHPLCKAREQECPADILKKKYMVVINELASGDLKQWANRDFRSGDELISTMFQIFMGVAKFQNMGFTHNDLHWGNALYHDIPAGGWWWYQVGGTDYYVRNTGQMWVIWDFGFAKRYKSTKKDVYKVVDFLRIIDAFIEKKDNGWMEIPDRYPQNVQHVAQTIRGFLIYKNTFSFHSLYELLIQAYSQHNTSSDSDLPVTNNRPSKVINKTPYKID